MIFEQEHEAITPDGSAMAWRFAIFAARRNAMPLMKTSEALSAKMITSETAYHRHPREQSGYRGSGFLVLLFLLFRHGPAFIPVPGGPRGARLTGPCGAMPYRKVLIMYSIQAGNRRKALQEEVRSAVISEGREVAVKHGGKAFATRNIHGRQRMEAGKEIALRQVVRKMVLQSN